MGLDKKGIWNQELTLLSKIHRRVSHFRETATALMYQGL